MTIITVSKHGRTRVDCNNLAAHLLKLENVYVAIAEIGNSAASNVRGVIEDMEIARDASTSSACLHHFSINPATPFTDEALVAAAHRVRLEFDKAGTRPYLILVHEKAWIGNEPARGKERKWDGNEKVRRHAHLVLGHVADGVALKDKFSKIRTEKIARQIEFDAGEPPTLGRHHKAVIAELEKTAPATAAWLRSAFGHNPAKPNSSMGSNSRQRAKRSGVSLPAVREKIRSLWSASTDKSAFIREMMASSLHVQPGQRKGVWIVQNQGTTLGALDRLLGLKREEVRKLMETLDEESKRSIRQRHASECSAGQRAVGAGAKAFSADQRATAAPGTSRAPGDRQRERSGGENALVVGRDLGLATVAWRDPTTLRSKAYTPHRISHRKGLILLRAASLARVMAIIAAHARHQAWLVPNEIEVPSLTNPWATDIWGIPIQPRRPR